MIPLAEQLRPHTLDTYIGQSHLVGQGAPLRLIIESGNIPSMIFWGPSGTGKTTLARIIAEQANTQCIELSAVDASTKDIREIISTAKLPLAPSPIVCIDEIHHFNKSVQDLLLPHIEKGTIILIGATTENPSFSLNTALLSRCTVYTFKAFTSEELAAVVHAHIEVSTEVAANIIRHAGGDMRKLLNTIESIKVHQPDDISSFLGSVIPHFDNGGDVYYNLLSALHKSVRGSHPDAALYYYARLINHGADPVIITRRALAIASEDVGLADPQALSVTLSAWDIYHRVGKKEGLRAIAEALVYLALAPKSNALYTAFNTALAATKEDSSPVPPHLCNAPTTLLKSMGMGEGYQYAHNFKGGEEYMQQYFPKEVGEQSYYEPTNRGFEQDLQHILHRLRTNRAHTGEHS